MDFFTQTNVQEQLHKCAESVVHHGVAIVLISAAGFVAGILVHRYKQAKYGTRVVVRVCWVEDKAQYSQVIGSGDALTMTGSKDVAATLVKAYRKGAVGKLLGKNHWTSDKALRALRRICEGISERFAQGAIARAMHDKDVTAGHFHVAAFRRENTVSVILVLENDLNQFGTDGCGTIRGSGPELREMADLHAMKESGDGRHLYAVALYQ